MAICKGLLTHIPVAIMFDVPPNPVSAVVSATQSPVFLQADSVLEFKNLGIQELQKPVNIEAQNHQIQLESSASFPEIIGLNPVVEAHEAASAPAELDAAVMQVTEPGIQIPVESTWQAAPVGQDLHIDLGQESVQSRQSTIQKRLELLQGKLKELVAADRTRQQAQAAAQPVALKPTVRQKLQPVIWQTQPVQAAAPTTVAPTQAMQPVSRPAQSAVGPMSLAIAAPAPVQQATYTNQMGYGVVTPVPPLPQTRFPGAQIGLGLIYPLQEAAPITSKFGWRVHPISGTTKFHSGVDLGGPYGAPVLATHSGQVVLAESNGGYGLCVMIRFADGTYQTLYGHLSQIGVRRGQWVQQGQVIGKLGSTGYSTGPHLHFELQQNHGGSFAAIDPLGQLRYAQQRIQQQATMPYLQGVIKAPTATISETFRL